MLRKLYIDNYRCFSNFEMRLDTLPCVMLVGANGAGKSTVGEVLSLFAEIGRGVSDINKLFPRHARSALKTERKNNVITLELEARDKNRTWIYSICVEPRADRFSVSSEKLTCGDAIVLDRSKLQISEAVIAMSVWADGNAHGNAISGFRNVLRSIYVVRPLPQKMGGQISVADINSLSVDASNFASWLPVVMAGDDKAYSVFREYLECVLGDFAGMQVVKTAKEGAVIMMQFKTDQEGESMMIALDSLSDGEKCQLLAASLIALNEKVDDLCVFWDEPDNYITTSEVAYLLPALCNSFQRRGQLIVVSHSVDAISTYGENEIIRFKRGGHYSPVRPPQSVKDLRESGVFSGGLVEALKSGEIVS